MRPLFLLSLFAPAFALASAEGVNPKATDLFEIGGIPVSNSILTTWILAVLIIIAVRVLVGTPKIIPNKGQALVETVAWNICHEPMPEFCQSSEMNIFGQN